MFISAAWSESNNNRQSTNQMSYELTGKIKSIGKVETFASGFTKREFIVEEMAEKYPQLFRLDFVKDKTAILDRYSPGDEVEVSFNIRGNEHNGKVYNSIQAWQIRLSGTERRSPNQNGAKPPQDAHNKAKADGYAPVADDDFEDQEIPF
jgi:hypothetical protein